MRIETYTQREVAVVKRLQSIFYLVVDGVNSGNARLKGELLREVQVSQKKAANDQLQRAQ